MRKLWVAGLVLLLLAALAPIGKTDTQVLSLVRVPVEGAEEAGYLLAHFDDSHNHGDGEVELVLWPGDAARLDSLGFDYEVVIEDLVAHDRALATGPRPLMQLPGPDRKDYRHLPEYNDELQKLAKKNPSLIRLFEMARPSLEGRTVFGVEVAANVKSDDGRPIFYLDGVHHAREWPAGEYPLIYAHYLAKKFGEDPRITSLLKRTRVIIVPIVNPDGFNYSRESPVQNSSLSLGGLEGYWRKNRRSLTGVTVPGEQLNPDAYGVDPNRNYAFEWGGPQDASSPLPFEQTYRGTAPFSEPETQNVKDVVFGRSVVGMITNHTVQGSVLRAGGGRAPEDQLLARIGQRLADILGYQNRPTVGYPTTGTTDDWAYAGISSIGFTIEHGGSGFHPPYSETALRVPQVMKAYTAMLEVVANPRYHSVVTGKVAGGKASLTLTKEFETTLSNDPQTALTVGETVTERVEIRMTSESNGSFEWHVGPSTRPYTDAKVEYYTLTIKVGGKAKKMKVAVRRGEVVNLGIIKL